MTLSSLHHTHLFLYLLSGISGDSCPQVEVLRGRDGRDGRDGAKGEKGDTPPPGHKGEVGPPGPQGLQGPMGISGLPGLVGEKGIRGDPGLPGLRGSKGSSGPRGATGEKGQRGDPGLPEPQGDMGPPTGGTTYIRWGRTTCPSGNGTELLYSGRAGGNHHGHSGGAANYLCMPDDPDHLQYQSGVQGQSYVAGVEYYYSSHPSLSSFTNHNVPCAVCYVATRSVAVMIPAKTQCPTNWTLEYIGYLMSQHRGYNSRTMYECVDKDPESIPGLNSLSDPRSLFELVEPSCNGLSCPPYDDEKELSCAVCSR